MLILANKEKPVAEKANRPQEIIITYSNVAQLAVGGSFRSDKNPKSRDCCCCFFSLLSFSLLPLLLLLDCEIPSCEEVKTSFQTELLSPGRVRSPLGAATISPIF